MNLFKLILDYLAKNSSESLKTMDANMVEYHHKYKKDKPSGTALSLAKSLENIGINVPVSSVRAGAYPGVHTLNFDAEDETLTISHTARSRNVFAKGVVTVAEWFINIKKGGLYNFKDFLC